MGCAVFDDFYSLLHALLGAAVRAMGPGPLAMVIALLFLVYEIVSAARKRDCAAGDIVEFIAGYVLAEAGGL